MRADEGVRSMAESSMCERELLGNVSSVDFGFDRASRDSPKRLKYEMPEDARQTV
jgi:hypothetical protein